jgi:hypothetical protein
MPEKHVPASWDRVLEHRAARHGGATAGGGRFFFSFFFL